MRNQTETFFPPSEIFFRFYIFPAPNLHKNHLKILKVFITKI